MPLGGEAREWGRGASQPASTSALARQDVAASGGGPTAAGSQAYLAVMAHAQEFFARTVREDTQAAVDKPEEEEDKPEVVPPSPPLEEEEAEYSVTEELPEEQDHLSEISEDDDDADKRDKVPEENELPILCRCRADLQDGRHVILSSSQTLEEWQAFSSCRASVEQKLRDAAVAGGASQPLGEFPIEFNHAQREECLGLLRQRWLDSGAPASKTCKFEGSLKEWEEKELREGFPPFRNNQRLFKRACANH